MINKIILLILGVVIAAVIICAGMILFHILFHYIDIVEDRVDEYFEIRRKQKEREEIEKFKRNI